MIVSAANDALFAKLCAALERPEWARDERFATNAARLRNRAEIDRLIGERLATDNRATWQARLQAAGIPVAPIQTTAEVVAHAQTHALGIIEKPSDDEIGQSRCRCRSTASARRRCTRRTTSAPTMRRSTRCCAPAARHVAATV